MQKLRAGLQAREARVKKWVLTRRRALAREKSLRLHTQHLKNPKKPIGKETPELRVLRYQLALGVLERRLPVKGIEPSNFEVSNRAA